MEKNRKILVVEDEALLALQVKADVGEMGHSITAIYASGEEALDGLQTSRPDLILMDIKLQGKLDGIQTANLIQNQYDIPIIYMTAHSEESTIERATMTEPYGYLLKPVNRKELQIAVEVSLYKSRIDKEKAQLTKELQAALEKVNLLSGMLPICCSCKKIRNDEGYWEQVEEYVSSHSEATFSHGICPDCRIKALEEHHGVKMIIMLPSIISGNN